MRDFAYSFDFLIIYASLYFNYKKGATFYLDISCFSIALHWRHSFIRRARKALGVFAFLVAKLAMLGCGWIDISI